MAALVTHHFRIHNAIQFYESFDESLPTRYYYFIGKNYATSNTILTSGTVKTTSTSNTIVGSATLFNSELAVGDIVRVTGSSQDLRVHSISSAQTFVSAIRPSTTITTGQTLYIHKPFDDFNPVAPVDRYQDTYYDIWRNMIAAKRIQSSDVSHVIPRYNWTSGTVYAEYDDLDPILDEKQFYVKTLENHVYKCIENNRNSASTVEPAGIVTNDIISTADGYRWKYMYTITSGMSLKFLTTNYMPVQTLLVDNSNDQWDVQTSAANAAGAIHYIKVVANGSNYLNTSNTFASVSSGSAFNLKPEASAVDGTYVGSGLFIRVGAGSGEIRKIIKYYGGNNYCIVNSAFSTTPNTSSRYIVSPLVTILGDSGENIDNRATAYVSNTFAGQVRKITIVSQGKYYTTANVIISANSAHGYGATGRTIISPRGGHGSDAIDELYGTSIMMNVRVSGAESNSFPTNNDFRLIGIMRDPLLVGGSAANVSTIDQTTRINVNEVSGDFVADEVITGQSSGATGRLVYFANTNSARTQGNLKLIRTTTNGTGGSFQVGETLQGATSTRIANVQSVTPGAMRKYSGIVIYTENRAPVVRSLEQTEDVKVIINF
jgi:hypothetical protein